MSQRPEEFAVSYEFFSARESCSLGRDGVQEIERDWKVPGSDELLPALNTFAGGTRKQTRSGYRVFVIRRMLNVFVNSTELAAYSSR